MTGEMKAVGWARVLAAVRPPHSRSLRAGTWYPVVRNELPDRVSVVVGPHLVEVPRRVVEVRPQRPDRFSVVYDAPAISREAEAKLGKRYGVCPECRTRFPLTSTATPYVRCPECGYWGEVGWWD